MQEELLQFKLQNVWTLVDLPISKRAIGTKWVFRNKKDDRGIVIRNKARLVAQGELTFFLRIGRNNSNEELIINSQDKYVADILKKFDFVTVKTASTHMEPNKALVKDEEAKNVDVHLYRSMIISLMCLTASRPNITFADYAGASLDRKSTIGDETVYKEWEDRMERAATTASSLEAEEDNGSGPRCQDTILGGAEAQSRFKAASK
ncbi:ribonuclease H-like domain-containing protein [Tanacetum coccineum]